MEGEAEGELHARAVVDSEPVEDGGGECGSGPSVRDAANLDQFFTVLAAVKTVQSHLPALHDQHQISRTALPFSFVELVESCEAGYESIDRHGVKYPFPPHESEREG